LADPRVDPASDFVARRWNLPERRQRIEERNADSTVSSNSVLQQNLSKPGQLTPLPMISSRALRATIIR